MTIDTSLSTGTVAVHSLAFWSPSEVLDGLADAMTFLKQRVRRLRAVADAGMTTAEYAVGTVAAVAFAAVLYKIVRSPAVSAMLTSIIRSALHAI